MKKLLLNAAMVLFSGFSVTIAGQAKDSQGTTSAVHEAHFKVLNYNTKEPIGQAGLFDKNDKQLGRTNAKGMLILGLPASTSDVYTVKADGFNAVSVRLTQASKASADYEVFLPTTVGGVRVDDDSTHPSSTQPSSQGSDMVKVYVKQDPSTYTKSTPQTGQGVEFAVQLSATSRPITDKNSLKSWEELGPVYIHSENGLYKVRIGPYDTQETAAKVLIRVKERGKKDAFIVVQKGIENHIPYDMSAHREKEEAPAPPVTVTPAKTETVTPVKTETISQENAAIEYKVRLASYLKPGGFNTKDIDQYGPLESYRQGDWTIMLIGGFKTAKDAQKVRDAVIAKGYQDAKVVVDRGDGILEEEN